MIDSTTVTIGIVVASCGVLAIIDGMAKKNYARVSWVANTSMWITIAMNAGSR